MAKVFVISECGINHNGDIHAAKEQILQSKEAGADAAKFQFYDPLKVLGKDSPFLDYARSCQFSKTQHEELKKYCDQVGIEYMCSVFDVNDIHWVNGLVKRHKIASRMNRNQAFYDAMMRTGKKIIMSIQKDTPLPYWQPFDLTYMHCVTKYPCTPEDFVGLEFSSEKGLSSHCPLIQPTIDAVKKGARVVENHTTMSRDLPGCDQASSITYIELKEMVKQIRALQ